MDRYSVCRTYSVTRVDGALFLATYGDGIRFIRCERLEESDAAARRLSELGFALSKADLALVPEAARDPAPEEPATTPCPVRISSARRALLEPFKTLEALTADQERVIVALIGSYPGGLTSRELTEKSKVATATTVLNAMRKANARWRAVIASASTGGRPKLDARWRLVWPVEHTNLS